MIRPLVSLERLAFGEPEGQVMVRDYGLYANAYRGKARKSGDRILRIIRGKFRPEYQENNRIFLRTIFLPPFCFFISRWMTLISSSLNTCHSSSNPFPEYFWV